MRRHPILGYRRMHTGVDYAAPRGTPILAAGNGIVEKAGRTSGYGNFTLIQHTNGYETAYGHQTAFAKGIVPGRPRPPGPDHRLCRLDRTVDRPASALRDPGQRSRRSIRCASACRAAACSKATSSPPSSASAQRIDTLLGNQAAPTKVAAASN